jgi:hypothetical protein
LKTKEKPLFERLVQIQIDIPKIYYITQYGEILIFTTSIFDRRLVNIQATLRNQTLAKDDFSHLVTLGYPEFSLYGDNLIIRLHIDQFRSLREVINIGDKWTLKSENRRNIIFSGKWVSYSPSSVDMRKFSSSVDRIITHKEEQEGEKAFELWDKRNKLDKENNTSIDTIRKYLQRLDTNPNLKAQIIQLKGDITRRAENIDEIDKRLKDEYGIDLDDLLYLASRKDKQSSATSSEKPRNKKSSASLTFFDYERPVVGRLTQEQLAAPDTFSESARNRRLEALHIMRGIGAM